MCSLSCRHARPRPHTEPDDQPGRRGLVADVTDADPVAGQQHRLAAAGARPAARHGRRRRRDEAHLRHLWRPRVRQALRRLQVCSVCWLHDVMTFVSAGTAALIRLEHMR